MIQDIGEGIFSNAFSLEPASEGDTLFCFRGDELLVCGDESAPSLPVYGQLTPPCHHIFSIDGRGCYISEEILDEKDGFRYVKAPALVRSHPDKKTAFSTVTAWQLSKWEQSRRFCGRCGTMTHRSTFERAMVCPKCGLTEYPKICPAIITTESHNGKLLMAKNVNGTRYSLIAGFVEIGETFEETVKREVMEEVGLKVTDIKYYKSQPWGFSDSQMIGFTCRLDGDQDVPTLQESEISAAAWFAPDEIQPMSNNISIASELIQNFIDTNKK